MAKIFQTVAKLVDPSKLTSSTDEFTNDQAKILITNYWGDSTGDKMFIASLDYLDRLFTNVNNVALRVVNIDNPDFVKADWIPYLGHPLKKDTHRDDVYYFILNIDNYSGTNINLTNGTKTNALIARLAKDEGKYYAIFYASFYELGRPGGTGNDAGNPGIKIPIT